jgi:methionyl-tRNA formyltransferase
MQAHYWEKYPTHPDTRVERVPNVNDREVREVVREVEPECVAVSGTGLLSSWTVEQLDEVADIVNLHTGLSPYVKGGPNCTNWCLANRDFHLIGNTVMWLDPGIDTGQLIATERPSLDGKEDLDELHWRVMQHGQGLYVDVISKLVQGESLPRIPQSDVAEGRTFYTVQWNGREMIRALYHFYKHYNPELFDSQTFRDKWEDVETFPL